MKIFTTPRPGVIQFEPTETEVRYILDELRFVARAYRHHDKARWIWTDFTDLADALEAATDLHPDPG